MWEKEAVPKLNPDFIIISLINVTRIAQLYKAVWEITNSSNKINTHRWTFVILLSNKQLAAHLCHTDPLSLYGIDVFFSEEKEETKCVMYTETIRLFLCVKLSV